MLLESNVDGFKTEKKKFEQPILLDHRVHRKSSIVLLHKPLGTKLIYLVHKPRYKANECLALDLKLMPKMVPGTLVFQHYK